MKVQVVMNVNLECDNNSDNVSVMSDVKSELTDFIVDEKVARLIQCEEKDKSIKQEVNDEIDITLVKDQTMAESHEPKGKTHKCHVCPVCDKIFDKASKLKIHMVLHTGEKNYYCKICSKSFTGVDGLNRHMQTHSGPKKFLCEICGKSFIQAGSLKSHMLFHSGQKDFHCTICVKSFTRRFD